MNKIKSPTASIIQGAAASLPVVLGYLPIGFAYGLLAVKAGFSPYLVVLMSFFVFAGSAQFIAVALVSQGASVATIVLTTFIVNLRHLLMSAAMVPYLNKWSKIRQTLFGLQMTDETFAVNLGRFSAHGVNPVEVYSINSISHLGWCFGGFGGAFFGSLITDIKPWGFDYALPAMFIALVLPHLEVPRRVLAVILAFVLSASLALLGAGQLSVIIATFASALMAAFLPYKNKEEA